MASAIIVAAGSSRRMGFDKLMADLCGQPVLAHSIVAFDQCKSIEEIIVVTDDERFQRSLPPHVKTKVIRAEGGKERHYSVANGLAACRTDTDFIAVHDGARPLITLASIELCLDAARSCNAATCARRITETVKRADDEDFVSKHIDRENLWAMETPQIFRADLLRRAYDSILTAGKLVTDEVSALESIDIPTRLVAHGATNLKITFPSDLPLAEILIKNQ